MAAKELRFGDDAWRAIERGVAKVANAVKVTMGPRGKNVVIEKKWGSPTITNDGVTIAKEIDLEDPFENMGAQLLKEVASKTNEIAGDGTTTATVLGQIIFNEGLKSIFAKVNPMSLKLGIKKAVEVAIAKLKEGSRKVETKEAIAQVACISANNDSEIGNLIADAMEKVGKDGVITVEESKGIETNLKVVEGMQFDKGYASPYMVTDRERMESVLEDCMILLTDKKISAIKDLLPVLEKTVQMNKPLLVIADEIEGEALATIVVNKLRGTLNCVAVKAPGFGDRRKAMLEDLAVITGGEVVTEEKGLTLENVQDTWLGKAKKIVVRKEDTTIIEGAGTAKAVKDRIAQIKKEIELSDSSYDKDKLKERLAKLSGGVAIIRAGAATETELKEKKHRIEDALEATRAAVEEGIIAGGGSAFIHILPALMNLENTLKFMGSTGVSEHFEIGKDKVKHEAKLIPMSEQYKEAAKKGQLPDMLKDLGLENIGPRNYDDVRMGVSIIRMALEEPLKQIVDNAGLQGAVMVEEIKKLPAEMGFDAQDMRIVNMFDAGIVDPLKVTRSALQNAASIASMLLTTAVLVAEKPETEKKMPQMPGGGGMGGYEGMM